MDLDTFECRRTCNAVDYVAFDGHLGDVVTAERAVYGEVLHVTAVTLVAATALMLSGTC